MKRSDFVFGFIFFLFQHHFYRPMHDVFNTLRSPSLSPPRVSFDLNFYGEPSFLQGQEGPCCADKVKARARARARAAKAGKSKMD